MNDELRSSSSFIHHCFAETRLPVRVADEPRLSTVNGLARFFDEPLPLRRVTRNEPPLIDAEDRVFES